MGKCKKRSKKLKQKRAKSKLLFRKIIDHDESLILLKKNRPLSIHYSHYFNNNLNNNNENNDNN